MGVPVSILLPLAGVLVGATAQYLFNRATDRHKRFHSERTAAYVDLVEAIAAVSIATQTGDGTSVASGRSAFAAAPARIAIYGSPAVVDELERFVEQGANLAIEGAQGAFLGALMMMRRETKAGIARSSALAALVYGQKR